MSSPTGCMYCKAAASSSPATRASRSSSNGSVTAPSKTRLDRHGTILMSAIVDFPVKPEARAYLDAFGRDRHKSDPEWLLGYRKRSLARFAELGFPSRRSEAWRYLDLRALEQKPMLPSRAAATIDGAALLARLAETSFAGAAHRLVLVEGRFAPGLSLVEGLPGGVWLGSMAEALAR